MLRSGADKPLDFGNGRVAGSVAPDGRLLALGAFHARLGYATLEGAAPFPDGRRRDPAAVRAYRRALAAPGAPGFGLRPRGGWAATSPRLDSELVPAAALRGGGFDAEVVTWAPADPPPGGHTALAGVVQRWTLRPGRGRSQPLAWAGDLTLGRAAMTELTEGGVLPGAPSRLEVEIEDGVLLAVAPGAGVAAACAGLPPGVRLRLAGPAPLAVSVPEPPAVGASKRTVAWALADEPTAARRAALRLLDAGAGGPGATAASWRQRLAPLDRLLDDAALRRLGRRGVAYVLGCCVVGVGDAVCLVTDHRILPLGWSRDGYWMARALLDSDVAGAGEIVRRHLRWLFEVTERPDGVWGRAYLPTGALKDVAFQLDQQCYPYLELADYVHATGDAVTLRHHLPAWEASWRALATRRAADTALFTTEETPGDDPLALPYHCSSHVLLWHTLRRLASALRRTGQDAPMARRLDREAHRVREASLAAFVVGAPPRLAYAVDSSGGVAEYHDANDLPTAFAPAWGFVDAADPLWRATLRFAFSPANAHGFFPGRFGGLGSVHTPGAWPLGDVQELLAACLSGDHVARRAAVERLSATACWDAALPEARDPDTGAVRSRHWFGWTGAALVVASRACRAHATLR